MDFNNLIQTVMVYALPVLFAITVHEAAHGYVARALGDNTAYMMGRVTLNPVSHIDPIGTILMPLMLYFATSGAFLFGYAKPVPVNFGHLRHPKRDMVWVALAGPASNFIQSIAWVLVNLVMWAFNLFPLPPLDGGRILVGLLPNRQAYALSRVEPYGFFIVLGLVLLGVVSAWWLSPLMQFGYWAVRLLLSPIALLVH